MRRPPADDGVTTLQYVVQSTPPQGKRPVSSSEPPAPLGLPLGEESRQDGSAGSQQPCDVRARPFSEHPEDLGRAGVGVPASVWPLPVCNEIRALGPSEIALQQCWYGADYAKATRLLGFASHLGALGYSGKLVHSEDDAYLRPLPGHCGHSHWKKMVGRSREGGFNTSSTAAYSGRLC